MSIAEWTPRFDDPRSVLPRALEFAAESGPLAVLDRLCWETLSGLDGRIYWAARSLLTPGKYELPTTMEASNGR